MGTFVSTTGVTHRNGEGAIQSTGSVSFPSTPISGNLLVIACSVDKSVGVAFEVETGNGTWNLVHEGDGPDGVSGAMFWKWSDGTESGISMGWPTGTGRTESAVCAFQFSGLDTEGLHAEDAESVESATKTSGTTGTLASSSSTAVAMHCTDSSNNTYDNGAWSHSFVVEEPNNNDGLVGFSMVYHLTRGTAGAVCDYTFSDGSDQMYACIGTWYLAGGDASIINLLQGPNLGADLYNGAIL